MRMRLASFLTLSLFASSGALAMNVVGEAYSIDGNELRYREIHQCSVSGDRCTVEYQDPRGTVFARKTVDYQQSLHSPSLEMLDMRQGETIRVEGDATEEIVIDAGFDHYVRLRWEELVDGETVRFPFQVVGSSKPFKMAANRSQGDACPSDRMCFAVALDNWLLSRLLSPIHLEYDEASKRLLQFRGVSNIRDENGKSQQVRIDYRYAEAAGDSTS